MTAASPPFLLWCRSRWRWTAFPVVVLLALVWMLLLGPAGPARAHASLIGTDPVQGEVLDAAPERVTFTFDETVVAAPDGVQVFDAQGDLIDSSAAVADAQLQLSLDEQPSDGTIVVAWRVVSTDGHPITGSLTFSVGAPSANPATPAAGASGDAGAGPSPAGPAAAPTWLSLARGVGYLALLLSAGLVAFAVLSLTPCHGTDRARRRLIRTARAAAAVAAAAWLIGLPLTASYQLGSAPLASITSGGWLTLPAMEYGVASMVVVGLLVAVVLTGNGRVSAIRGASALSAAALAAAAPAFTGHTRAATPEVLAIGADVLHLLAGSVWLGGLVALALVLPVLTGRSAAAAVLARFSGLAAGLLAALVVTGTVQAWTIAGSWGALVATEYGLLLMFKVGIAVVAALIAAWNRFTLLPRVRRSSAPGERDAGTRLVARSTAVEAVVLTAVVLVTAFLVDTTPEFTPSAVVAAGAPGSIGPSADVATATLGDVVVVADISPRSTGATTVIIQLQHPSGGPAEGVESLSAQLSSDKVDLGEIPLVFVAPGSYAAQVVLPASGTWRLQVSVRRSEFVNPVTTLELMVPGTA